MGVLRTVSTKKPETARVKPEMTDESALRFRERLIRLGLVTPGKAGVVLSGAELDAAQVQRYKQRLIKTGFLVPA